MEISNYQLSCVWKIGNKQNAGTEENHKKGRRPTPDKVVRAEAEVEILKDEKRPASQRKKKRRLSKRGKNRQRTASRKGLQNIEMVMQNKTQQPSLRPTLET